MKRVTISLLAFFIIVIAVATFKSANHARFQSRLSQFEAISTTNLSQWKAAIEGLKKLDDQLGLWCAEQPNRLVGIPIVLTQNTNTVQFKTVLLVISAQKNTGNLIQEDLQSQNLNIDETRQLGLQLCKLFEFENDEFLAWCDKVGNHWLDAPLYGRGNHYFGFKIIRTYNDEKPWCINVIIVHP
jgi:hypothetical protein